VLSADLGEHLVERLIAGAHRLPVLLVLNGDSSDWQMPATAQTNCAAASFRKSAQSW
jgi:hypothetical protein